MSYKRLLVGDAVRVYVDDISGDNRNNSRTGFGFIRFIGFIQSTKFTQWIGVELIEEIADGHDGTVNNVQYFKARKGYGIHIPITNIIEILSITTVMLELKATLHSLQETNSYIQNLESIINSKKKPKLVMHINVDLPPSLDPSRRDTFILPAAITPITPNAPIADTPNSINSFPPILIQHISTQNHRHSQPQTPSISLTQSVSHVSDTFDSYEHELEESLLYSPSTPITPFTPSSLHKRTKSFYRRLSALHNHQHKIERNNRYKEKKKRSSKSKKQNDTFSFQTSFYNNYYD